LKLTTITPTNYIHSNARKVLQNKASGRGVNINNTNIPGVKVLMGYFQKGVSLGEALLFYLDCDRFVGEYGLKAFTMFKEEYWKVYSQIVKNYAGRLPRLPAGDVSYLFELFDVTTREQLHYRIKYSRFRCEKCGSANLFLSGRVLHCVNCESCSELPKCTICSDHYFSSRKQAVEHYSKKHSIDVYENILKKDVTAWCVHCKTELKVTHKGFGAYRIHTCTNKNCKAYKENMKKRTTKFKSTINNRTPEKAKEISKNYSQGAYKREMQFRLQVDANGKTRKENISEKSREYMSQLMKAKIARGEFTPCATNSWARSRCVYNNIAFRSTFELLFYTVNTHLEFEVTRIPYEHEGKKHTYIVDFTDTEGKVLYEIKPISELVNKKVETKMQAAVDWCSRNGYSYTFITEEQLKELLPRIEVKTASIRKLLAEDTLRKVKNTIRRLKR